MLRVNIIGALYLVSCFHRLLKSTVQFALLTGNWWAILFLRTQTSIGTILCLVV